MFWRRKAETRAEVDDQELSIAPSPPVASSHALRAHGLAVSQACAGLIARSLSQAKVSDNARMILTPSWLATCARQMTLYGESLSTIGVRDDGMIFLSHVHSWDVLGGNADPATWRYHCNVATPSGDPMERVFDYGDVVHLAQNGDVAELWRGRNVLQHAGLSAGMAAFIERALGQESSADFGEILSTTVHSDETDSVHTLVKVAEKWHRLASLRGGRLLINQGRERGTGTAGFSHLTRLHFDPTGTAIQLRRDLETAIAGLYGVPLPLLHGNSDGTGMRELWRQFALSTVAPLATMISQEASMKLERDIMIDLTPLRSSDFQGLGRAIRSLVDSGMTLQDAMDAVGLND